MRTQLRAGLVLSSILIGSLESFPGLSPKSAAAADEPTASDKAAIESLGKLILARLDVSDALRAERAEAATRVQRAQTARNYAEKARLVAEIAIREYRDGTYPEEVKTADLAIKLAENDLVRAKDRSEWTTKLFEQGQIPKNVKLADEMLLQKAEISLKNEKLKREVLERFTLNKQTSLLKAEVTKSEINEREKQQDYLSAKTVLEKLDRQLANSKILDLESQAIVCLADTIRLFEEGKSSEARAKLEESKKLWSDGQDRLARAQFEELKSRIQDAAGSRR